MSFTFSCPMCEASIEAEKEWGGTISNCPNCGKEIEIPVDGAVTNLKMRLGTIYKGMKLGKPTSPQAKQFNEEAKEDNFVLDRLKRLAELTYLAGGSSCIVLLIVTFLMFIQLNAADEAEMAFGVLFGGIITAGNYFLIAQIIKIVLLWMRGMYRHTCYREK